MTEPQEYLRVTAPIFFFFLTTEGVLVGSVEGVVAFGFLVALGAFGFFVGFGALGFFVGFGAFGFFVGLGAFCFFALASFSAAFLALASERKIEGERAKEREGDRQIQRA